MIKEKTLSKRICDASFNEIIRQLEYKERYKNKHFYQINKYYPASHECSVCGRIDKKYKNINERNYKCQNCQNEIDINASINIMYEGLKLYVKAIKI